MPYDPHGICVRNALAVNVDVGVATLSSFGLFSFRVVKCFQLFVGNFAFGSPDRQPFAVCQCESVCVCVCVCLSVWVWVCACSQTETIKLSQGCTRASSSAFSAFAVVLRHFLRCWFSFFAYFRYRTPRAALSRPLWSHTRPFCPANLYSVIRCTQQLRRNAISLSIWMRENYRL